MLGKTYDNEVCSIARALEVVGERWSLLILRNALFAGATRFNEFQRSLGIASNVLQSRLDRFVDAGLMQRQRHSERPELHEYVLTEKGQGFAPALIALTEWGDRFAAPDGPPILYRHTTCGSEVHSELVCAACGRLHEPTDVEALPGPGMPAERAERVRARAGSQPGVAAGGSS